MRSREQRNAVAAAKDAIVLRALRGCDDYVVSPCYGLGGAVLEGTRLTVQDHPPEGVDVSIRTPLTPRRWAAYGPEMQAAWEAYCAKAIASRAAPAAPDADAAALTESEVEVLKAALCVAFFWFNFMPLTRGSAATGWTMLMALLLACDLEVSKEPPEGLSLDWEAILTSSPRDFVEAHATWLADACLRRGEGQNIEGLPPVRTVFGTYRQMLMALSMGSPAA